MIIVKSEVVNEMWAMLKLEGITFEECSHQDAMSPTHPSAILLIYQNVSAVRRGWAVARDVREGNL